MEKYTRSCEELFAVFIEAYDNCYILLGVEEYNKRLKDGSIGIPSASKRVLEHIVFLAQKDLALCLWKINIDNNSKANNLSNLRNHKKRILKCETEGYHENNKISSNGKKFEKEIAGIRNKYLAHDDFERTIKSIKVKDMCKLLEQYRAIYNELASIDDSFMITDSMLAKRHLDIELGLLFMTDNSRHLEVKI